MKEPRGLEGGLAVSVECLKHISYDPAVLLFCVYYRQTLAHMHPEVSINVSLETLSRIAKMLSITGK